MGETTTVVAKEILIPLLGSGSTRPPYCSIRRTDTQRASSREAVTIHHASSGYTRMAPWNISDKERPLKKRQLRDPKN